MLKNEEIQHKIDYEIIVDCYDEYEVSMGWYYYMEETLKFPFKAKAKLKKADGSVKLTEIQVTGLVCHPCIVLKLVDSFTRYTQSDKIAMYCVLSLVVHL